MTSYVDVAQNLLKKDKDNYNCSFWWNGDDIEYTLDYIETQEDGKSLRKREDRKYKNSDVIVEQINDFISRSTIPLDLDRVKALISFVLCYAKLASNPNIFAVCSKDPDGV